MEKSISKYWEKGERMEKGRGKRVTDKLFDVFYAELRMSADTMKKRHSNYFKPGTP